MSASNPHRELSGVLFQNRKKKKPCPCKGNDEDCKNCKRPDSTGEALINGERYYVASWLKQAASGDNYRTLAFTPADKNSREEEVQ
jgi:hypothetical protein